MVSTLRHVWLSTLNKCLHFSAVLPTHDSLSQHEMGMFSTFDSHLDTQSSEPDECQRSQAEKMSL